MLRRLFTTFGWCVPGIAVVLVLNGCVPNLVDKPEFAVPPGGLPYALSPATPSEARGVVVSLRPSDGQVVHYIVDHVAFVGNSAVTTKWGRGRSQQRLTEVWSFDGTHDRFRVKESSEDSKQEPGDFILNSRYRLIDIKSGTLVDNENSDIVFPEKPVQQGSTWLCTPAARPDGKDKNPLPKRLEWKCIGFADVPGHRCAVLETHFQLEKETRDAMVFTNAREVIYVDYNSGLFPVRVIDADATAGSAVVKTQLVAKMTN